MDRAVAQNAGRKLVSFAGQPLDDGGPLQAEGGLAMTFEEILDQAMAILQRRGRLTYGTLKRQS